MLHQQSLWKHPKFQNSEIWNALLSIPDARYSTAWTNTTRLVTLYYDIFTAIIRKERHTGELCGCWEFNLGPLDEHQVLLTWATSLTLKRPLIFQFSMTVSFQSNKVKPRVNYGKDQVLLSFWSYCVLFMNIYICTQHSMCECTAWYVWVHLCSASQRGCRSTQAGVMNGC